jgi:hypothetical protein
MIFITTEQSRLLSGRNATLIGLLLIGALLTVPRWIAKRRQRAEDPFDVT